MMTDEDFTLERGPWVNPILMEGTCLLTLLCYSRCSTTREGDMAKSDQPYSPEKVRCFHSQASTQIQWHLVICRPECRIAGQQGASSPLHHAVNSGATAGKSVWEKVGLAESKLGSGSRVVSAFTLDILIEEIPD